ncbi:hypothetical protein DER46DRAFT_581892 [Fusarium sp. MPI-SDFR-AT-0072]|nr:hypothetical protein DER46DRAFT_581892 [Fusarium sp. MPI-SDFR-AT-0072]
MAAFPDDVWRNIIKYLSFKDLGAFKSSHRHAVQILGKSGAQKLKPWETMFAGYEWAKTAGFDGKIPVLLFIDEDMDKPYVYLYLTTKKADKEDEQDTKEVRRENEVLFNEIKASLRPTTPGRHHCEVEFKELTLNISHIRYGGFIECKNLVQKSRKKSLTIAMYGKLPRNVKPQVLGREFAAIHISGFQPVHFRDRNRGSQLSVNEM